MNTRLLVLSLAVALALATACSKADNEKAQSSVSSAVQQIGDQTQEAIDKAKAGLQDSSKDVREAAVRNGVSVAAPAEFRRHDVDVDGTLTCTAESPARGQFTVNCTGNSRDGKHLTLTGNDPGDGPAQYVGSVDGAEVFRQNCVGVC